MTQPWTGASTGTLTLRVQPIQLFCFPHAGGTVKSFVRWRRLLGASIEPVPVPYPTPRENISDLTEVVEYSNEFVHGHRNGRYAFYGHSMGALVAFGVVQRRQIENTDLPERLFLGASAPSVRTLALSVAGSTAAGTAQPRLREDLRLCSTFTVGEQLIRCPVHALGGRDDPIIPFGDLNQWKAHSATEFTIHSFPGGHFFTRDSLVEFTTTLRTMLELG